MKKILSLVLFLFCVLGYSQLKVGSEKSELIGKVQFIECKKLNDNYLFVYNDHKYTQIDEYKSFYLSENDFNELYKIIIENFEIVPNEPLRIETPNDVLFLNYTKNLGVVSLQITHFVNKNSEIAGLTRYLTKKQVLKLFGKK